MSLKIFRNPISPKAAPLGRLVLDRVEPHHTFFDPRHADVNHPDNITELETSYNALDSGLTSCSLVAKFSKFMTAIFAHNHDNVDRTSTSTLLFRNLNNADDWLADACKSEEVRDWIERRYVKEGRKMYLIVGHWVATDPHVIHQHGAQNQVALGAHVADAASNLSLDAQVTRESIYEQKIEAQFRGKTIVAVEYRELQPSWLSGRSLNDKLERGSRWTAVSGIFRGGEDTDEEEVIQVELSEDPEELEEVLKGDLEEEDSDSE